ncbi:MAG: GTPase Era [Bacteroidia bacterium]|nr:MAG: GTPase Era [Bacteroidia bacterium]
MENTSIKHYCGFVNIIGCPNAGKSTLINAIMGFKLNIVTPKAQTTRQRILAIYNEPNYQIIFSDTPGIIQKPSYELHQKMIKYIDQTFEDADIMLLLIDAHKPCDIPTEYIERLKVCDFPVFVVFNKIDLVSEEKIKQLENEWRIILPKATIKKISALKHIGVKELLEDIKPLLKESPPFYEKDDITDKTERFIVSEVIREKILLLYNEEVPYAAEVIVNSFKEDDKIIRIQADIIVERETQKMIIIGEKGKSIKQLGIAARKELEAFFKKQIYLELFVKVEKNWRNNKVKLNRFGYKDVD